MIEILRLIKHIRLFPYDPYCLLMQLSGQRALRQRPDVGIYIIVLLCPKKRGGGH